MRPRGLGHGSCPSPLAGTTHGLFCWSLKTSLAIPLPINSLYVLTERQGQGIGQRLLQQAARELISLAFSMLQIDVLSANMAARAFYEAMGGYEIGQGTFDEEGYLLPETVYAWHDLRALAGECTEPA